MLDARVTLSYAFGRNSQHLSLCAQDAHNTYTYVNAAHAHTNSTSSVGNEEKGTITPSTLTERKTDASNVSQLPSAPPTPSARSPTHQQVNMSSEATI